MRKQPFINRRMYKMFMTTVIGRGHSGTRSMSHTLSASGVYMGEPLNVSGDLIPAEDMYEACRVMAKYVEYKGGLEWDFSKLHTMPIDPAFTRLVESFLSTVLSSKAENRGWKLPETALVYPWIIRMFPEVKYIFWVRDPRDCILNNHLTDHLSDFGVPCDQTDDIRLSRAYSWKYQRDIVKASPKPASYINLRFEDMVFDQDNTLAKLEKFLGIPMAKIEMRPGSVGRYKNDEGTHMYEFFKDEMIELGYELEPQWK
ncbi:MAG: sulfotransferase [Ruminococcaceae bacterium]|nr:sulfotransferase [Oscillospiraceae bacterium]